MATKAPTINQDYQATVDEILRHLQAALAAQERAEALDGDEHTGRQAALTNPLQGVGASALAKRWYPSLRYSVERMEREQRELSRNGGR